MERYLETIKDELIKSLYCRDDKTIQEDLTTARKKILNVYRNTDTEVLMETLIYFDNVISELSGLKGKHQLSLFRSYMNLIDRDNIDAQVIGITLSKIYTHRLFLSRAFGAIRESRNVVQGYNKCLAPGRLKYLESIAKERNEMEKKYFNRYILKSEANKTELLYLEEGKLVLHNFTSLSFDLLFHITKYNNIYNAI